MKKRRKAKVATKADSPDHKGFDDLRSRVMSHYGFGLTDEVWTRLPTATKAGYLQATLGVIKVLAPLEG